MKKATTRKVKHHHVFIIVFLSVSILFAGNIIAIDQVYKLVSRSSEPVDTEVILARYDDSGEEEPPDESHLNPLADKLTSVLLSYDTDISVGVVDLESGEGIGLNDTTTYQAASFYKLFVAYEIFSQVDERQISLNDSIATEDGENTIGECIRVMISFSDNPCGRALRSLILADVKPLPSLAEAGFVGPNLMNEYPVTSVKDVVLLMEKLYRQQGLKKPTNTMFMDALKGQAVNNRLPQGLPDGTEIAHKTADLEGFAHDGGIVYAPFGDYIVVIMSGPWLNGYTDAPPVFAELSELIYEELSSLSNS